MTQPSSPVISETTAGNDVLESLPVSSCPRRRASSLVFWIPAFAGMTASVAFRSEISSLIRQHQVAGFYLAAGFDQD